MFRVGQKVVCVDALPRKEYRALAAHLYYGGMDGLQEGVVYTIAAIGEYAKVPSVWLVELPRGRDREGKEAGFHIARFRPAVERKTDISVFREILRKTSRKQTVKAH